MIPEGANSVLMRGYHALRRITRATAIAAIVGLLNIGLDVLLVRYIGYLGIALALGLSRAISTALFVWDLSGVLPGLLGERPTLTALKALLALMPAALLMVEARAMSHSVPLLVGFFALGYVTYGVLLVAVRAGIVPEVVDHVARVHLTRKEGGRHPR